MDKYSGSDYKVRSVEEGAFPINDKLAGIVPMALPFEQAILIEDIRDNGQREPVVLWRGQVVDGRCRQRALVGLSRQIVYRELDDELTVEEVKSWVKSMNTRRNLTSSQRIAIACKQYIEYKASSTVPDVAKAWFIILNSWIISFLSRGCCRSIVSSISPKILRSPRALTKKFSTPCLEINSTSLSTI